MVPSTTTAISLGSFTTLSSSTRSTNFTGLPAEIRDHIYQFLTPCADPSTSRDLANRIGVAAVSHEPPPLSFLLTCKQLYHEATDAYYRKTKFTIERAIDTFSLWTMYGVEETLGQGQGKAVLGRLRKVEVDVFWHWLPSPTLSVGDAEIVCPREKDVQLRVSRMQRIVGVLLKAQMLRFLTVTWKEVARLRVDGDEVDVLWEVEARRRVLAPLRQLKGLRCLAGDIVASDVVEKEVEQLLIGLNRDMEDRDVEEEPSSFVGCAGNSTGLTVEDKRVLAELLMGEGQYLLTPEDREIHRRKGSYFE
jgi:hypothetical protein